MGFQLTKKKRCLKFKSFIEAEKRINSFFWSIDDAEYRVELPLSIYTRTHSVCLDREEKAREKEERANILNKYWWIITTLSWRWWATIEMHTCSLRSADSIHLSELISAASCLLSPHTQHTTAWWRCCAGLFIYSIHIGRMFSQKLPSLFNIEHLQFCVLNTS